MSREDVLGMLFLNVKNYFGVVEELVSNFDQCLCLENI